MTQYKISIAPEAAKEIEDIYLFIANDSPNNAARWYFAIYDKIYTLKDFPARFPIAFEDRYYDYVIRHLIIGNYRVLYRIKDRTVQILHVKHGAQERNPF
ncbi:MAG: type II toxin-antitoxin system RelE/ParE family toxin [Nitrosomonas sp.]|nr:type II toxin-antitoxin system RelE/ParE family toxin [Nitrosomonas sp.]